MSEKNLRDHIARFYQSRSLPDRTARRLIGLAQQPKLEEDSRMHSPMRTWRPAAVVGLTASLAVILLAAVLYLRLGEPGPGTAREAKTPAARGDATPLTAVTDPLTPKLVAVKIHADWCARTPDVAPIFADLTTEHGNQPILFVTLDITDETGRRQARYLVANLGIESVYDEPFESGMIKLIDRQAGQVLAVVTGEEQRSTLEGALAQALPRHD